jgi:hypothetical protein
VNIGRRSFSHVVADRNFLFRVMQDSKHILQGRFPGYQDFLSESRIDLVLDALLAISTNALTIVHRALQDLILFQVTGLPSWS